MARPAPAGLVAAADRHRIIRYRLPVTVWQTLLVFVGIPAGIIALIVFGVYGKALLHQPNRYRPGKAWNYPPSWYVPHPDAVLTATGHKQIEGAATSTTAMGGASGEW